MRVFATGDEINTRRGKHRRLDLATAVRTNLAYYQNAIRERADFKIRIINNAERIDILL